MARSAVPTLFWARPKSKFGENLATQASKNVWKKYWLYGLLSSFSMSAIYSFLKCLRYDRQTSIGNVENTVNTQPRFGSALRDTFFAPSPVLLGFRPGLPTWLLWNHIMIIWVIWCVCLFKSNINKQNLAFFSWKKLTLIKDCQSCIFNITNLFWWGSMTMQGANISLCCVDFGPKFLSKT